MSKGGTARPIRLKKAAVMPGSRIAKERDVERPGRESAQTTQVSFGSVSDSQVRFADFSFAELSLVGRVLINRPAVSASGQNGHSSRHPGMTESDPTRKSSGQILLRCKTPITPTYPFNCYSVALGNCQAQSPNCHAGTYHPV